MSYTLEYNTFLLIYISIDLGFLKSLRKIIPKYIRISIKSFKSFNDIQFVIHLKDIKHRLQTDDSLPSNVEK